MDQENGSTLQPTGYTYRDDLDIDHKITIFRIMMMRTENLELQRVGVKFEHWNSLLFTSTVKYNFFIHISSNGALLHL